MRQLHVLGLALALTAVPIAFAPAHAAAVQDGEKKERPAGDGQEGDGREGDGQEGEGRSGEGQDGDGRGQQGTKQIVAINKATLLADRLLAANGGVEVVKNFTSLQYTLTPVEILPVPAEPGATTPPTFEEKRLAPIAYQASFAGDRRFLRMDEPVLVNGRDVVTTKILRVTQTGEEVAFLLDGRKRTLQLKELRQQVVSDLVAVSQMPEMMLGLVTGQIRGSYDGATERNGMRYETIAAQFTDGRAPDQIYRIFIDPATNLIARWEVHDVRRKVLALVVEVGAYASYDGLQFPASLTLSNDKGQPFLRWEYTGIVVNAEIDPARFEVP